MSYVVPDLLGLGACSMNRFLAFPGTGPASQHMSQRTGRGPRLAPLLALGALPLLSGCDLVLLDPAGDVARQQGHLILFSTGLMMVIILPVMALTCFFAWRYRAANRAATYRPDWDHSTGLELIIWAAPLLIIICLGAVTWVSTHLLDPYRPLARTAPGVAVAADMRPLEVNVVALDWKWLFIYPEQGIATVNEFAAPIDRPVRFRISATSVMNSFYIPALAGQIYAMPGMETKLHGVFNEPGEFVGFSANYSGAGFSGMRFTAKSLDPAEFDAWVEQARQQGQGELDRAAYLALERPSEHVPVQRFGAVEAGLFDAVVNMCVEPGKMCMHDRMMIDERGGMGVAGLWNLDQLHYDKRGPRGTMPFDPVLVAQSVCTVPTARPLHRVTAPGGIEPLRGIGLTREDSRQSQPAVAATLLQRLSKPQAQY